MNAADHVVLFYNPHSRATGVRVLLEEMTLDYELKVLDFRKNEQRSPAYLAINPMGKVPAVKVGNELVTEQTAIYTYLSERFPEKKLAPLPGEFGRGEFLRWMAFYGSCFEPALVDKALKREPGQPSMMPYGDYETTIQTLAKHLKNSPYMLGERFTALDALWAKGLDWTMTFGIVENLPAFTDYVQRMMARPAFQRAKAKDDELVKQMGL